MKNNKLMEVVDFLKEHPGYLKKGSGWLAGYLNTTKEEVKEAKKIIRDDVNIDISGLLKPYKTYKLVEKKEEELPELSPLQVILEETKIPQSEVDRYWYKGKNFSIHAKTQSISPEEQFKHLIEEAKKQVEPKEIVEKVHTKDNRLMLTIYINI